MELEPHQGTTTRMCARLVLTAVPLLAALALGQAGAIEMSTLVWMDDGVGLNTSLFMPDGTAAPNGGPAIDFFIAWAAAKPPPRRGDEREFAMMRRVRPEETSARTQPVRIELVRQNVSSSERHVTFSCPTDGARIG